LFYKFFCNVLTKTRYFNIAFVSLRYKNSKYFFENFCDWVGHGPKKKSSCMNSGRELIHAYYSRSE